MSPEYAMEGFCSIKSDVFSFGVLLLEIISSRKNNSFYDLDGPLNLIIYVRTIIQCDKCYRLLFNLQIEIFFKCGYVIDCRHGIYGIKVQGWN